MQGAYSCWVLHVCLRASGHLALGKESYPSARQGLIELGQGIWLVLEGASLRPTPHNTAEKVEALAFHLSEPQILPQFKPSLRVPP